MKITFTSFPHDTTSTLLSPVPAITKLPDWYKEKSPFTDDTKKQISFANRAKNISVKWCNPFGDALGGGYFILLQQDIEVRQSEQGPNMVWLSGGDQVISTHGINQIDTRMIPEGFDKQPYKFANYFHIKTPKGYSTLFTHPLNRPELPFRTLDGIVDTDNYPMEVNFPFLLRVDFEGIIEMGTPIAQLWPYKRENWQAEIVEGSVNQRITAHDNFYKKINRPYKNGFWQKKIYR